MSPHKRLRLLQPGRSRIRISAALGSAVLSDNETIRKATVSLLLFSLAAKQMFLVAERYVCQGLCLAFG